MKQTFCVIAAKGTHEIDNLLKTYQGIKKICESESQSQPNLKSQSCKSIQNMQKLIESYNYGLSISNVSDCSEKYSCNFPATKLEVFPVSKRVSTFHFLIFYNRWRLSLERFYD